MASLSKFPGEEANAIKPKMRPNKQTYAIKGILSNRCWFFKVHIQYAIINIMLQNNWILEVPIKKEKIKIKIKKNLVDQLNMNYV